MLAKCLVLMLVIGYLTHLHVATPSPAPAVQAEAPKEAFSEVEAPPVTPQHFVRLEAKQYGWHEGTEWEALHTLVHNESSWQPRAVNPTSGACGLFQSWPCAKMGVPLDDIAGQARWGTAYIKGRYGSPSKALSFWKAQCGSHLGCWY